MDFLESEENQMIRDMVRDFAESVLAPTAEARDHDQRRPSRSGKPSLNSASKA